MTMRERMEDLVMRDMLGPGSERFNGFPDKEETITVYEVWYRYSVGLLYPQFRSNIAHAPLGQTLLDEVAPNSEDQDNVELDESTCDGEEAECDLALKGAVDPEDIGALSRSYKPSAMGLSFVVEECDLPKITIEASAGIYLGHDDFAKHEGIEQLSDTERANLYCCVKLPGFSVSILDGLENWRKQLDDLGICIRESEGVSYLTFKDKPQNDKENWRQSEWYKKLLQFMCQWKRFLSPVDEDRIREDTKSLKGDDDSFVKMFRVLKQGGFSSHVGLAGLHPNTVELIRQLHILYAGLETLHLQWSRGLKRFPLLWAGTLEQALKDKPRLRHPKLKEQRLAVSAKRFRLEGGADANRVMVFLSLYNLDEKSGEGDATHHALTYAQPKIRVKADTPIFCSIDRIGGYCDKLEDKILAMQYRNRKIFARGCGCSVSWGAKNGGGRVAALETEFMPRRAIYQLSSDVPGVAQPEVKAIMDRALSMTYLGDVEPLGNNPDKKPRDTQQLKTLEPKEEKLKVINSFVSNFETWVSGQDAECNELSCEYKDEIYAIKECWSVVKERMLKATVALKDENVYKAFCLANEAVVTAIARQGKSFSAWRPFQFGFILSTLESIVNSQSEDRDCVDLLWFPTGGGKTEAYLALTAFAIFYRYLTLEKPAGTTVIMRYTLKLLAMQQFSRAATLICACDRIRKREWQHKPRITIGLWVGSSLVPNKVDEYIKGKEKFKQPERCPWCGGEIVVQKFGGKVDTRCKNQNCAYYYQGQGNQLPLDVVDECIYRDPPTLLFGTVDKFAQLTFVKNGAAGILFGLECGKRKNDPPSLIIQDELHLITETLGSLVGAYETVVDGLCRGLNGAKPKIVASTATVKRADEQCRLLYARPGFMQFPPPGLSVESSYFSRETEALGREYFGIQSHGLTPADTLIRLMASILVRADHLKEFDYSAEDADQYYTMVGYFSSMRELGSCESWVRSKIQDRVGEICAYEHYDKRFLGNPEKLNSLNDSIKKTLDKMEKTKLPIQKDVRPIDVLLATNMLSVGLDVDRMGLMVVAGQPKKNAEFIQASSRVGRNKPEVGLVVSFFNGKRARDRSYFEVFPDFIQSFYKYVEPTTVTPFTFSVRERLLRQVLVTLVRHLFPNSKKYEAPGKLVHNAQCISIRELILAHVPVGDKSVVAQEIDQMMENWEQTAYSSYQIGSTSANIFRDPLASVEISPTGFPAPAMMALRNVDAQVPVKTISYPMNH